MDLRNYFAIRIYCQNSPRDAEAVEGFLDFFAKRSAGMRSFAAGVAGWHVLLLFYSNTLFAFDGITSLGELHLQEPLPKRNLAEPYQSDFIFSKTNYSHMTTIARPKAANLISGRCASTAVN